MPQATISAVRSACSSFVFTWRHANTAAAKTVAMAVNKDIRATVSTCYVRLSQLVRPTGIACGATTSRRSTIIAFLRRVCHNPSLTHGASWTLSPTFFAICAVMSAPMLTSEGCQARRSRLFESIQASTGETPDWIVVCDPEHQMYFAGFYLPPYVFRTANAAGVLAFAADGTSVLIADSMVKAYAEAAYVDEIVAPTWYRGVETAPHREAMLIDTASERLGRCDGALFGYERSRAFAGLTDELRAKNASRRWLNIDPIVHLMKRQKDPDELDVLRRSMAAGEAAHAAALHDVRPGMNELQVFLLVQDAANEAAGEQVIVYGDFVSGPRCQSGGGPPSLRVIERGDLVLLDFSVVIGGYRGDFANTFVCGADPTEDERRWAAACLDALAAGEAACRAGVSGRSVDDAVRDVFSRAHLEENFRSHSGHGLGLGHPDPPYLVRESTDTLLDRDVIAIEPHQIISGKAGMRFERNYLVTEEGLETLSHHALTLEQTT